MIRPLMNFDSIAPHSVWHLITRLGEIQILIPAALLVAFAMLRQHDARVAGVDWLGSLGVAALITTITKVAFIGWEWGYAPLNFTGISGHSMFAAAVFPMLLGALPDAAWPQVRKWAFALGALLAVVVGVSRLAVGVHSVSEVASGLALGGCVSLYCARRHALRLAQVNPLVPLLVMAWLVVSPLQTPQIQTHSLVTQLALKLSGRTVPYTRADMQHRYRTQQLTHAAPWQTLQ